ncbi:hypothetical protein HK099_006243 [Clydaea vesicula]|uniref:Cytochrome b5 heme-binding domain-containing protein n=1 Tax=Clydaea vesicula TaxID=447962 RepID=A0AAD5XUF9_9FUNG|nr:hypothetical protein HK099_006243 [Clydaea vesicula]KAJ3386660.1 hypothetical protein HDU92_002370 [Lobulomyces angularis]
MTQKLNWTHIILLTSTPILAIYGCLTVPLQRNTFLLAVAWYFLTGFGITVGYHRYWSHRTYDAIWPFQFFLMLAGSGAVQGSIKWWSRDHRAHHRFTDTDKDPYSAHKGLLWAHMGWMLFMKEKKNHGKVDISDLNKDFIVNFQEKFYPLLSVFMSFILPTLICGYFFNDYAGGFFYVGMTRQVFLHHSTFCINSLAHYMGEHNFDDRRSPRDNWITALITFGEGYHNFHHEFPSDYRNAIQTLQYDPSKWIIYTLSLFGITYNLNQFSKNEIDKGRLQMQEKKITEAKSKLDWGVPIENLMKMTWIEFVKIQREEKKQWMVIDKVVYDVEKFMDHHPGGKGFLKSSIGREVTTSFNGGVYNHSRAARNLMTGLRIAIIQDDIPAAHISKEE